MQLPSIDSLRCFAVAARSPTFRAAARELALTPAALGQRIRGLEEQLGVELFKRTTRSLALTEEGLALLPRAQATLDAAAKCLETSAGAAPTELTFGTRHELGMSFLLPLRDELQRVHAGLTLHFYFGSGSDLLGRVRLREIDCAVTSTRFTDPTLDAARLHREDYAFVGAPELLARRPLKRTEDAGGHTLIDISAELPLFRYWRDAPAGGDRLHFAQILRAGSIDPIRTLVLAGEGVAVLPLYQVQPDLDARRLEVILPEVRPLFDHFRLVFRSDDARRPMFEAIARTLLEHPLR
jgi:LysR family glycine cleavage system transcriptional activator